MYFLYRFLDKNNNIIYIGKTQGKNLRARMKTHCHLPVICYLSIAKIDFCKLKTSSDLAVYEIYYINKYKPIYNTAEKYNDGMSIILPELQWEEYIEDETGFFGTRISMIRKKKYNIRELYDKVKCIINNAINNKQHFIEIHYVLPDYFEEKLKQDFKLICIIEEYNNYKFNGVTHITLFFPEDEGKRIRGCYEDYDLF